MWFVVGALRAQIDHMTKCLSARAVSKTVSKRIGIPNEVMVG